MYFFMKETETILSVFFLELPCSRASYFSRIGVSSSSLSVASRSLVVRMSASPAMASTSPDRSLLVIVVRGLEVLGGEDVGLSGDGKHVA